MAADPQLLAALRASIAAVEAGERGRASADAASRTSQACGAAKSADRGRVLHSGAADGAEPDGDAAGLLTDGERRVCSLEGDEYDADAAYRKILRSVGVREQSTARMRRKLLQAGFPADATDEAIARAVRVRALDDARYIEALVRSTAAAGRGLEGVRREADELGIVLEELDAYNDYFDEAPSELDRALALLDRQPPRAKNKRAAAYRKLVSKGFSSDTAAQAARRWCEQNDAR